MRGRWAAGIVPRNFCWIITDKLAVSERPGGYAPHHRRVRRQEEILWLKGHGFTRIVSLLASTHNLHAYDELGIAHAHFPLPSHGDGRESLTELYPALLGWLRADERILLHHEELNERLAGVVAGFLYWSGMVDEAPRAVSVVEHLLKKQMGAAGRTIVATVLEMPAAVLDETRPAREGELALSPEEPPDPPTKAAERDGASPDDTRRAHT